MASPLSREDVLDELGFLAMVEHALVVEYLSVPPSAAQLERLLEREQAITAAVDARYSRLRPAVTSDPCSRKPSSTSCGASSSTTGQRTLRRSRHCETPWERLRRPRSCARPAGRESTRSSDACSVSATAAIAWSSPPCKSASRHRRAAPRPWLSRPWKASTRSTASWCSAVCYPLTRSPDRCLARQSTDPRLLETVDHASQIALTCR